MLTLLLFSVLERGSTGTGNKSTDGYGVEGGGEGKGECMLRLHDDMHVAYTSVVDVCEREREREYIVCSRPALYANAKPWMAAS